jgi:hypothetical protein
MSAIDSLIKIKFYWNFVRNRISNHDSVSHRPISELKRLEFAQPADLPVQQAVMVTNLKTAKAFGITFPLPLLGRADEVIE